MNGMVTVVLMFPRYLMIAGITVLALAFCMPALKSQGDPDFEKILPLVLSGQVPTGVLGFLPRRPRRGLHVELCRDAERRARLRRE